MFSADVFLSQHSFPPKNGPVPNQPVEAHRAPVNLAAKFLLLALVGGLGFGLAACRQSDQKPVHPLTGRVLYRGKPAEGASITFVPLDDNDPKSRRPGAQVEKDGSFRLSTYASYDGAPSGRYAVTIVYPSPEKKENDENAGPDLLCGRYADPKTTPLKVEVKEETSKLEPFGLP